MDGRKARCGKACTRLSMTSDTLPQTVSANGGLSSPGAVWHMLQIQDLALSHCCAAPCREPFLIGNLPRRPFPRCSARVAPQHGLHVTLPGRGIR